MGLKIASFVNDGRVLDVRLWGWWWCVRLMNNRKVCKAKCSNFNTKHIETLCSTKRWKNYNERKSWCSLMLFLVCAGGRRKALNCRLELTFPGKNAAKSKKCVCMKTRKTSKWLCVLSSEFLSPKIVLNKRQKSNSQMNTHKIFKWSRRACVSFFFSSYWMKNYARAVVNAWHTWRIFVQQIALCVGEHASPSQKSSVWKK